MQIVPPVDTGLPGTAPGQVPANDPYPSNTQLDQSLDQAVADINRMVGYHISTLSVSVGAAPNGTLGPYGVSLSAISPSGTLIQPGRVNDIRRVLWTDSQGSVPILLFPTNRNALDRGQVSTYYNTAAGFPQMWYIEGYTLYVSPYPSDNGTLTLTTGSGVVGFTDDQSVLDQIPVEYQWIVEYQAVTRISKSMTMDIEAKERAQMYGQDAERGILQFKAWIEGQSGVVQPTLAYGGNYRGGYGTRRTIR